MKSTTVADAWNTLDALDADEAYVNMSHLLAHPSEAIATISESFRSVDREQAQLRKWIAELDRDQFRVRETAQRSLLKIGLRAIPTLTDPKRKPLGAEGERRVKTILEAFENKGLRAPESGFYGEPLRMVRGVRILELIGSDEARKVLEDAAKGADSPLTREAKAALETWLAR